MLRKSSFLFVTLGLMIAAGCGDDDPTGPQARIGVDPASVTFTAPQGGADPDAQSVSITNTGTGTLSNLTVSTTYGSGEPTGWLSATLASTTAPTTLSLSPTVGTLEPGTYTATVNVASTAAANSPRPISVTFTVGAAGHTFEYTPPAGAPSITSIYVPGAHNGWSETGTPMTFQNGVWRATVSLAPGRHEYKFRINDDWVGNMCDNDIWGHPNEDYWVDLGADGCTDDGFGGANAYVDID